MSNTSDYWYWKKFITKDKIKEINNFINNNFDSYEDAQHPAKTVNNESKKTAVVKTIKYKKIKEHVADIVDTMVLTNQRNFGYILHGLNPLSTINLNFYSEGDKGKYDWHTDSSINDISDIKLTGLINVSEKEYEGGDFYIFNNNEIKVNNFSEPGDMILLKSNLHHKVSPVVKGERRTLTIFFEGPKFR